MQISMTTYKQNNLGGQYCTCPSHSNLSTIYIPASPPDSSLDSFPFANSFNDTNPNPFLAQSRERESRFRQKRTSTSSSCNTAISPTTQSHSHSDFNSHKTTSSPSLAKIIVNPLVKFARRVSRIFSFSSQKATAENESNASRASRKREKTRNTFTVRREDLILNLPRSIRPDVSEIDYLRRMQSENGIRSNTNTTPTVNFGARAV
jgi:hypothetical protein